MSRIGVLLISTWKYNRFIDNTIKGIRKHFFRREGVKIFLHTDSPEKHDADLTIPIVHKPWPYITLERFSLFSKHQGQYDTEYLIYLDVDVDVVGEVKILADFFVTRHYLYLGGPGTPERNPSSTAFIATGEEKTYVAGGFFGGRRSDFLAASETMKKNIDADLKKGIVAVWQDESHLNRYALDNPVEILDHKYLCINELTKEKRHDVRIVPYSEKRKGFNKFAE